MMRRSEFTALRAFAAVAERRSFARAAAHLRVSPSALSQTVRRIEEQLGVRLLNRTTRSVALTEAGARLLARLGPALAELDGAVADLRATPQRPGGTVRLTVPRAAATAVLAPLIEPFCRTYPGIVLDVTVDDRTSDVVAGGFDAGIRLGEHLHRDMVAVKLTGPFQMMAVASPRYLARHGTPATPRDLCRHRCINYRWPTEGGLYRWEFQRGRRLLEIDVEGPLAVNDAGLLLHAALDGVGIVYTFGEEVLAHVKAGRLVRLLAAWSPVFPGFHLYYPSRRQPPPALAAFVAFARERVGQGGA